MSLFSSASRYALALMLGFGLAHFGGASARAEECGGKVGDMVGSFSPAVVPGATPVVVDEIPDKKIEAGDMGEFSETDLTGMNENIPESYALRPNFPNPFNPSTDILFDLPETAMVSLVVYDVLGREVVRLVEGELPAGWHRARFDAGSLPSGVYLYRIQAGDFMDTGRMTLLK